MQRFIQKSSVQKTFKIRVLLFPERERKESSELGFSCSQVQSSGGNEPIGSSEDQTERLMVHCNTVLAFVSESSNFDSCS